MFPQVLLSLPVLGVWIEVGSLLPPGLTMFGHSLYWECGLKSKPTYKIFTHARSLPVLGVWIEVTVRLDTLSTLLVTPCIGSVD